MVINDEDEDSNTALHLAALNGYSKTALALIVARANVEARYRLMFSYVHHCKIIAQNIRMFRSVS